MAHVGVDRVGEVDRGGTLREGDDLAARGEDVDLGACQVETERVEELRGVLGLPLPVDELSQPGHLGGFLAALGLVLACLRGGGEDRAAGDHVFLVLPVRGDAVLRALVHAPGADLQFHRLAARAYHRRVQRLVHVELRHRDVVLEPAGDRVPSRVDRAEGGVAVPDRVDQHSDAYQVVDVVELNVAGDHLLVDRVVVLRAAGDRALDPRLVQVGGEVLDDFLQQLVPARRPLGHQPRDLVITLGVERGEREVFQLPLDRVHAEAVRQRGVDLQGLAGLALLLVARHVAQGAHVVQAVGELDDQDADVPGHRDDHLPDGLCLRRRTVLDLVQLGHAVDEGGDVLTEVAAQLTQGVRGVLDGVVQQGRADRLGVHAELGEDRGHREGMGDVRVARLALLVLMPVRGDRIGTLHRPHVRFRVMCADGLNQRFEDRVHAGPPLCSEPRKATANPRTW